MFGRRAAEVRWWFFPSPAVHEGNQATVTSRLIFFAAKARVFTAVESAAHYTAADSTAVNIGFSLWPKTLSRTRWRVFA
jgi:hypothetical protein